MKINSKLKFFVLPIVFFFSCNLSLKIAYNKSDLLSLIFIDNYFNINYKQKHYLKKKLKKILVWHKSTELKLYRESINNLRKAIPNNSNNLKDIDKKELRTLLKKTWVDIKKYRDTLFKIIYKEGIEFLLSLEDYQVSFLEKKINKSNEKINEEYKEGIDKYYEKENNLYIKRTKEWIGSLSEEQIELLKPKMLKIPIIRNERIRFRNERKKLFLDALKHRKSNPKIIDVLLKKWCVNYQSGLPVYFSNATENLADAYIEYFISVIEISTPEQLMFLKNKFLSYENLIEDLYLK